MKMRKPSVEDMLNNKTTRYSLVMAVAKRATINVDKSA